MPAAPFDVARIRADFPILALEGARQAAGLPRQRGQQPDAAAGASTAWCATRRASTPTSIAACTTCRETATAAYEGARAQGAALHQRARGARGDLHQRHHRCDQPGDARLRPQVHRRRRRDHRLDARAPLEHRPVADAVRTRRAQAARDPVQRRRRAAAWTSTRSCSTSAPSSSASRTSRTRSARSIRSSR